MSRKHYVAMAEEFKAGVEISKAEGQVALNATLRAIDGFCCVAKRDNSRFDVTRFKGACGIAELPMIGK